MPDQNHEDGRPVPGGTTSWRAWLNPNAALLAAAIVAGAVALWSVKERHGTPASDRAIHAAALADASRNGDALPITRDMSLQACNRSSRMAAGCIGSETSLRQPALEAWRSAPSAVRKECLEAADSAPEPVGALYACLRSKEQVAAPSESRH